MDNNHTDLSTKELQIRKELQPKAKLAPGTLNQLVLDMAAQALKKFNNRPLPCGHFTLMAAADGESSLAVELIDEEKKTKLKVFEPRDNLSPYLLEITPLPDYFELFLQYRDYTITVSTNDREVLRTTLTDDKLVEFIPCDRIQGGRQSWSYQILPKQQTSNN